VLKSADGREEVSGVRINKLNRINDDTFDFYEINFKSEPMNNEEERLLIITEDYSGRLEMLPKKITVKEDQLVVYSDTQNFVSVYLTNEQRTEVLLPSDKTDLLSFTDLNAERLKDRILYHINSPVEPLKTIPLRLHYEFNHPLMVFNNAQKIFEVSHWGNVAIEERYQIENVGAKLEGEFGRVDYDNHGRHGGMCALKKLRAKLPLRSNNLWYRDEIGNVSTSRAARNWDDVGLELIPRFPILGGWKSNFWIGYNLPSKFLVSVDDNRYTLNLTFGMPFQDIIAKNYTVSVALPEGATGIDIKLPIESKYTVTQEKYFSFLDFFGRPMVVINVKNAYDIHNVNFQIHYNYSSVWMLVKPAILIFFFSIIFALLLLYSRIELSLSNSSTKVKAE
jgi:oligosaccharyltransferase complex subunit alpha (ribophorin I)